MTENGEGGSDAASLIARALSHAQESFITASGPGGQNVNKVATAVQLRVNIYKLGLSPPVFHRLKDLAGSRLNLRGEIVLIAQNSRTQEGNRNDARMRLEKLLRAALIPPKPRAKSRLNRIGKTQRLDAKKRRGAVKSARLNPRNSDW